MLAHVVILVLIYHFKHHVRNLWIKLGSPVRLYLTAHCGLRKNCTIAPS